MCNINFQDLLRDYALDQKRRAHSPTTIHNYRVSLLAFHQALDVCWCEATPERINRFLDDRHLSTTSRRTWIHVLRAFYRWAKDEDHLRGRNPMPRVAVPRKTRSLPRPMDQEDLLDVLDRCADPNTTGRALCPGEDMRLMLLLGSYQGLRCMEIAGLRWGDVKGEALRILGKGGHERIVPLHPLVGKEIAGRERGGRTEPLLTRRTRGGNPSPHPYSAKTVSTYINRHLHRCGYEDTAHALRHRFITEVYELSEHDLLATAELAGHASVNTTAIYAKVRAHKSTIVSAIE